MNRRERRKLQKQGVQVPKDPSINIKLSDLGRGIMTPAMESAMMHEINQQCLEADARFSLDLDTMVLWTLYQCYGWREKRLHDFYLAMAREHRRMREYYQMDDLYPERYKLKEKGIDIEKWQEELAELTQAALKMARKLRGENPTPMTHAQAAEHLHEELGDVRLCLKVLDVAMGGDNTTAVEAEKLQRWLDRLTPEQRKTD